MQKITIYSTPFCVYCKQAKVFLTAQGISYQEVDLSADTELWNQLATKYNWQTVPLILIGQEFIGGYDDLRKIHDKGELLNKLNQA